jgi:3-oxoacyl-[acyl-carrier protein] reductase
MLGASVDKDKRVALVTGAGSPDGIGFATARLLGQQGFDIAITSTTGRIEDRARELAGGGIETLSFATDLMKLRNAGILVEQTVQRYGRIDVLVNNAGMAQIGHPEVVTRFAELTEEDWDHRIAISLKTAFNVTKAVLPQMLRAGYGRIVNMASVTGPRVSNPGATAYSAAKAAMIGFTRSLALEVAGQGITVNAVAPGWIKTGSSTEQELVAGANTPLGRPGTPNEVAALIAFLASESASYITGEMVVVDGGNTIQEYKGPAELYY